MKNFVLLAMALAFAGCKTKPISPTYSSITLPAVGITTTIGIGEQMLEQGIGATGNTLILSKNIVIGDITVFAGTFPHLTSNAEYRAFAPVQMSRVGKPVKNGKLFLFNKDAKTKLVCVGRENCVLADYEIGTKTFYAPSSNQQTLLYSGRIGSRVTLSYREFVNNIARPAFSNDVAYDLNESMVLGYKGARIEVINATNTEITYKVIAGFK
ncbi:hypothetical protein AB2N08_03700 [Massilia aurea]|uniref:hypothetical protein n=1 Tax=Massilia aurea TaxID=373040 RepID=UPI003461D986